MEETLLTRFIKKVILPKYPNIKDFTLTEVNKKAGIHNSEAKNFYTVHYFVEDDVNWDLKKRIEFDTQNLFNVLGTDKYDVFESILFFKYSVWKMTESLEKLIGNIIPPKYPWIKDFRVFGEDNFGEHEYIIHYYVDENEYKKKDRSEINRIISETKNLYTSLGPSEKDFLKDISFENYGEWFKN